MNAHRSADTTRVAGTLRLSVYHIDNVADGTGGVRRQYGYLVELTDTGAVHEGDDLRSGVGAPVDAEAAVRTLASFLSAAGESYRYVLDHPESEPENLDPFPSWVAEAAYLNADELAMLLLYDDTFVEPTNDAGEAARFVAVVFQQSDDAAEALAILDERGPAAAIEHLAQWDNGQQSEDAAKAHGQVYDEVPIGERDAVAVSGHYVMTYNLRLGYVGLVRKIALTGPVEGRGAEHDRGREERPIGRGNGQSPWTDHEHGHRPSGPARPPHSI